VESDVLASHQRPFFASSHGAAAIFVQEKAQRLVRPLHVEAYVEVPHCVALPGLSYSLQQIDQKHSD
jgi:hypothetical protein